MGQLQGPLQHLAERIDRLLLRHEELQRASALMAQQLAAVTAERDSFRSRLSAARGRIDALLDRLPPPETVTPGADAKTDPTHPESVP